MYKGRYRQQPLWVYLQIASLTCLIKKNVKVQKKNQLITFFSLYDFLATTTASSTTVTATTVTATPTSTNGARRLSDTDRPLIEALMQNDLSQRRHSCTGRFLTMHKRRRKKLNTRGLATVPAILDDILHGHVRYILDHVGNWEFNAFILENVTGGT